MNFSISDASVSVGDLANVALLLVATVALVFAYLQAREASRQRRAQVTLHVYDMLSATDARRSRRHLLNQLPETPNPETLSREDWEHIEAVWVAFQRVAIYLEQGLIDEESIFRMYSFGIITAWEKLAPYVDYQGIKRGGNGIFLQEFRQLADKSRQWWSANFPGRSLPTAQGFMKIAAEAHRSLES